MAQMPSNEEEVVQMTLEQMQRFSACKAVLEGKLSIATAATVLNISQRQVQRLKQRVKEMGPKGLVHGNYGREPANKTSEEMKSHIIELATNNYSHLNYSQLADALANDHHYIVSAETLRRWLSSPGDGVHFRHTVDSQN